MTAKLKEWTVVIAIALFGAGAGWAHTMIKELQAERDRYALKATNAAAALDTSRAINDSLAARLAVQGKLITDFEARELGWKREVAQLNGALALAGHDTAHAAVTVVAADTTDRQATFSVDSVPLHATAHVVLPPPATRPGSFDLTWRLDTVPILADIGCRTGTGSVKAAEVGLSGPTWAHLRVGAVRVDPTLCNPVPTPISFVRARLEPVAVGGAAGLVVAFLASKNALAGIAIGALTGLGLSFAF